MRVLILGSGARESAIACKFSKSKHIDGLFVAPGNAGTAEFAENIEGIDITDAKEVLTLCENKEINYVFFGPEAPLVAGVADKLRANNIECFGPGKAASQLEGSKVFSKAFMEKYDIPTASAKSFSEPKALKDYITKSKSKKLVIKKSGLAAGKGVFESDNKEELINFALEAVKDDSVLVEEFLDGYEISIFVLSDGKHYAILPSTADFKKAGEGDTGLNTGGMGAICPVPNLPQDLIHTIEKRIVIPTINGLNDEGLNYKGVIYCGLMITDEGPKVLEYNVRFGDPETQALIPLMNSDIGDLMYAIAHEKLDSFPLSFSNNSAVSVVIAADGYPGSYKKGVEVTFKKPQKELHSSVFHASTIFNDNTIMTNGGRCFTITATGKDLISASRKVYEEIDNIAFNGGWYRKDIGKKFWKDNLSE